jgi:hypothetical protein
MIWTMYYRLIQRLEIIQEAVFWHYRALGNKCRAIGIVCMLLEKAVPMLQEKKNDGVSNPRA